MTSEIPYGHQSISDEDIDAVAGVLRSDWLTTGPAVRDFEAALISAAQARHAIAVTSGTAALHVAYAAVGVGRGSRIITSPRTFVATAATPMQLGADVAFVDFDQETGCIDPSAVSSEIREGDVAVTAVDYAGQPADVDALATISHKAGAIVIEDAAHSIGSSLNDRPVGSIADVTTFSFFPTKNMTTGEGGAVVTDDVNIAAKARSFRNHGLIRERSQMRYPNEGAWHQEVQAIGLNYRLPDILAALGISQLKRLHTFRERRQAIFDRYSSSLANIEGIKTPSARPEALVNWHLYPVRVDSEERERIFEYLHGVGIKVQVNYIPVYWHPVFEDLGYKRGMCPNAEAWYREEISLPMYPALPASDQDRVIEELIAALR